MSVEWGWGESPECSCHCCGPTCGVARRWGERGVTVEVDLEPASVAASDRGVVGRVMACGSERGCGCERWLDGDCDRVVVRCDDAEPDLGARCRWHVRQRRAHPRSSHRAPGRVATRVVIRVVPGSAVQRWRLMLLRKSGGRADIRVARPATAEATAAHACGRRGWTIQSWPSRTGRDG